MLFRGLGYRRIYFIGIFDMKVFVVPRFSLYRGLCYKGIHYIRILLYHTYKTSKKVLSFYHFFKLSNMVYLIPCFCQTEHTTFDNLKIRLHLIFVETI